jgi:thioesterase domain-containing protein
LIHGAEGNVLLYRNLAVRLGANRRVYGLQSRGLDGEERLERSIEGMAVAYFSEIKAVQPRGPYYLGGYCLGGAIALEIAQRVIRSGEQVALLAMIETYNLHSTPPASLPLHIVHKAQNLYFQMRNVALSVSSGASDSRKFLAEKLAVELNRFTVRCHMVWTRFLGRFRPGHRPPYASLQILVANHEAVAAYQPAPFEGRIVLFRPKSHYLKFNDPCLGWGSTARHGVRVIDMPSYPRGSLNHPFVEVLARALDGEIEQTIGERTIDGRQRDEA